MRKKNKTKFEFYWRPGSWKHPDEWVFDYYEPVCGKGCRIIECGFFTITILRNGCGGDSVIY